MRTIDLNADVGEGFPTDAELIPLVTSANIACGGHAGDEATMEAAARVAIELGVAIGAHPGHEDREYFGRRELPITPDELQSLLRRQVDRLHAIVAGLGGSVGYLKPHGALYHQASRDDALAQAVIQFVHDYHTPLGILCQADSALYARVQPEGIAYAEEFLDRLHLPDGSLAPRSQAGAVLTDSSRIAGQAVRLAAHSDSLCLHGDHNDAADNVQAVRTTLEEAGWTLRPFAG